MITEIERLANLLTPISDIAVLVGVDEDSLRSEIENRHSFASMAYRRGRAKRTVELREADIESALAGSPSASIAVAGYLRDMANDQD